MRPTSRPTTSFLCNERRAPPACLGRRARAGLTRRNAELESDEVTVTISQIIGDTTIVVPRHVDVELSCFFLIGDRSVTGTEEELPPSAPRVHVRSFGVIGDLKVVRR